MLKIFGPQSNADRGINMRRDSPVSMDSRGTDSLNPILHLFQVTLKLLNSYIQAFPRGIEIQATAETFKVLAILVTVYISAFTMPFSASPTLFLQIFIYLPLH
jgi:hypothetical protein